MKKPGVLNLSLAVLLAVATVLAYMSSGEGDLVVRVPTEYASDVFTIWETLPEDSNAMRFSGVDVLGNPLEVIWRNGVVEADEHSLKHWKEEPGEMAKRWRGGLDEKVKLRKMEFGWQLERGVDVVIWNADGEALFIPQLISDWGGVELQFPDSNSPEYLHRHTAYVDVPGGKYLAQTRGDRTLWVYYSGQSSVSTSAPVESDLDSPTLSLSDSRRMCVARNHRSEKDMDILWNEEAMTVDAVGADGKVVWSKALESAPVGSAYEVDIYANKKYQVAFATKDGVHLIDVKGRNVSGFPYKPESDVTGFCVVDYDSNKKFRFLVATSDGAVANLKGEAKRTSGWKFAKLGGGSHVQHLAHLRVGAKDYIYAGCNDGSVLLLKRTGAERTKTDVQVFAGSTPAFRLSSSIGNSSVLFINAEGWIEELRFQDASPVGMSKLTKAESVASIDTNGDGKKEIVVHLGGKRLIWNSRNELISE